jgi:Ssp1 endopeptidase immunity protein Rap1a
VASTRALAADGNLLYEWCTTDNIADKSICFGYLAGALDADLVAQNVQNKCAFELPKGVEFPQITDVVVKHLRENPETRN